MRIAHVITRLIVGGAQENTVASVIGLSRRSGLTVELIAGPTDGAEGTLVPLLDRHGIPVIVAPSLIRPVHPVRDLQALLQLTRLFRQGRPDIVHTHSGKAGILGRLAAHRAGVPIIVHTIHGPSFGPFQGAMANGVFRAAERHAARVTDHFVSVADAMTLQYLDAGVGRPEQFTTIRSGFDLAPFLAAGRDAALQTHLGISGDDFVIGMIARVTPLKGHHDLVRMLPHLVRQCPRVKLLLVGDGPLRAELEAKLAKTGLAGSVRWAGLIAPEEMARYVGLMDVLVHLSVREGLARALPQALAAGRPVIAYDCDGAREVCREGETGYLIPPGDAEKAADRLLQLIRDPARREALGRHGRELVCGMYSTERMVDELHALYSRLRALPSSGPDVSELDQANRKRGGP